MTCLYGARWPSMIDTHGVPRSWRHFLYGLRLMGVIEARESLRMAGAASVPHMKDPLPWYRQQERAAGI